MITGPDGSNQTHEDHLLLACINDGGQEISEAQIHSMLALPAATSPSQVSSDQKLRDLLESAKARTLSDLEKRNAELFQQESDKLDRWAEDQRKAQKSKLEALDKALKELKQTSREASTLAEKVRIQQEVRKLEQRRNETWRDFDDESRRIDDQRDEIESNAFRLLDTRSSTQTLFTISWSIH